MQKCPYCDKEMLDGKLLGDHKALKWLPKDKEMLFGLWACGGLKIGDCGIGQRAEARAWYCSYCKKIIIDVDAC